MSKYDIIIIGSGPAGYTAAFEAKKFGLKTAVIEKDINRLGGVCLNEGCVPLKGFLRQSLFIKNYFEIKENVFKKVEFIRSGLESRLKGDGIDIIIGEAEFISNNQIKVNEKVFESMHFIVAAGARPTILFNKPYVFTPEKIFAIEKIPEKILLIGGGAVGCEFATFFHNMNVNVDIVEILDSLIYGEDEEAVRVLTREFKKKKINIYTNSEVIDINENTEAVIKNDKEEINKKYDIIIETTGRMPHTENLGLKNTNVAISKKGFLEVNDFMQTASDNIYAVGDCINTPMLAYTAFKEAENAVKHIAKGIEKKIDYNLAPKLVFSSPQIGSVGQSEKGAKERNVKYSVKKYFFKAIGKAMVEGKEAGFLKLIINDKGDEIIGAVAVGEEVVDILNELTIIIQNKLKIEDVKDCLHIHPSYSEIIIEALNYG